MSVKTPPLQFKGSLFTLTILQIQSDNIEKIEAHLTETIKKAPNFFTHAPIVLDVTEITSSSKFLDTVTGTLRINDLIPIGIMSNDPKLQEHAIKKNLALFPKSKQTTVIKHKKDDADKITPTQKKSLPTKIITNPVRSGQQIYAKDADLIILNSVSHGAEIIADGNIHVYGNLHGRALAGVNGNTSARIFCKHLDAELISIAGLYQLSDDFKHAKYSEGMQVYLKDEKLYVEQLQ